MKEQRGWRVGARGEGLWGGGLALALACPGVGLPQIITCVPSRTHSVSNPKGGFQQVGRFALVATIFIGLECAAVLLGYFLLAEPMGLFRRDSSDKMGQSTYPGGML
jgi:hypothetical protein